MKYNLQRARRGELREGEDPKWRTPGMTKLKRRERKFFISNTSTARISSLNDVRHLWSCHAHELQPKKIWSHQKRYRCDALIRENAPIGNMNSIPGNDETPKRKINQFYRLPLGLAINRHPLRWQFWQWSDLPWSINNWHKSEELKVIKKIIITPFSQDDKTSWNQKWVATVMMKQSYWLSKRPKVKKLTANNTKIQLTHPWGITIRPTRL